ncbi:hypothetical protein BLNAU_3972 [Blattamonas nauphoetae]|uniref:Uncharacterized protein n=1 Tax=Blattamonas nauphoetae TaxID=2049346 RepID=A0ABQ9YC76_9EUKA|nr:hypothetical protein BLNAU_3972 [Blattamonas nauphoetae]
MDLLEGRSIVSIFETVENSSPPSAVITTLARISFFPHLEIAYDSLWTLYYLVERDPPALTLLPSPIFPFSSPHQQYSDLSFLAALTKKLRIVFSEFLTTLPTDPTSPQKYFELTGDDTFVITCSLEFCDLSISILTLLLRATPPVDVDSEIIQELILFVKEALSTILSNISNIDTLIASLPSDSSPTTPLVSGVDAQLTDSLKVLRKKSKQFVSDGWRFFIRMTFRIVEPHKSSFQTIILDDPSFPSLILNSLKLTHQGIRRDILMAITNIVINYPSMKERFMTANLVGRMFETVDFVSLPLSESRTLSYLTDFITRMCFRIGFDVETRFEQLPLIRVSVFEPAKQFLIFMFRNSDKLILNDEDKADFESFLCWIHNRIKNMELRSDEHDADIVSELVKWEGRTMVEMENEEHFEIVFESMLNRTSEWNRDKRERQKRREVRLREEGWDDAFELRVVGIEVDSYQDIHDIAEAFRIELALNTDEP